MSKEQNFKRALTDAIKLAANEGWQDVILSLREAINAIPPVQPTPVKKWDRVQSINKPSIYGLIISELDDDFVVILKDNPPPASRDNLNGATRYTIRNRSDLFKVVADG